MKAKIENANVVVKSLIISNREGCGGNRDNKLAGLCLIAFVCEMVNN